MIDHHAIVREFDGQDYTFSHTSPGRLNYPSTCDQTWCVGNLLSGMKSTAPPDSHRYRTQGHRTTLGSPHSARSHVDAERVDLAVERRPRDPQ